MDELESIRTDEIINDILDKKCAPGIDFKNGSCISLGILMEMANAFNKDNKAKAIKLYANYDTLNPSKYKKYLLKEMKKRMESKCTSQQCWTEQSFVNKLNDNVKEELHKYTFRPEGPNGKFEWLNTLNINDVMEQYEVKYPDFKFLGAVPIDFDDLKVLGLRDFDFKKTLDEGKKQFGIIFNLDEHYKSGSHWVGMYAHIPEGKIYFFDSYGIRPETRIRKFMRRIAKFCQTELNIKDPIADYSKTRHQYMNSECGTYSINFILRMLKGETFDQIQLKKIPDKTINKCRSVYFKNVDNK
jgi:hypothetical protein